MGDVRLVAVDPGIRGCGVAVFDGDELAWAGYVASPVDSGDGLAEVQYMALGVTAEVHVVSSPPYALVVERPQVYFGSKANPNALLNLAAVGAAVAARLDTRHQLNDCHWVLPRVWKGNVSKEETETMVQQVLTPAELVLVKDLDDHNAWDAVGIGLYWLGRLVPMHRSGTQRRRRSVRAK